MRAYEKTSVQALMERDTTITDEEKHSKALAEAQEARDREEKSPTLGSAFLRDAQSSDALSKLLRYETAIERRRSRALHELQLLQTARLGVNVPLPLEVDIDVAVAPSVESTEEPAGSEGESKT